MPSAQAHFPLTTAFNQVFFNDTLIDKVIVPLFGCYPTVPHMLPYSCMCICIQCGAPLRPPLQLLRFPLVGNHIVCTPTLYRWGSPSDEHPKNNLIILKCRKSGIFISWRVRSNKERPATKKRHSLPVLNQHLTFADLPGGAEIAGVPHSVERYHYVRPAQARQAAL